MSGVKSPLLHTPLWRAQGKYRLSLLPGVTVPTA